MNDANERSFFRAFNYIYSCMGTTSSPMVLCHLLNVFCLPVLLYELDAVPLSNANMATQKSTWRVALYKIFHVQDINNLLYIQRCMDILSISFVVDLRKLNFLHKQSVHVMTIVNAVFYIFGFREYDILCTRYSVTNGQFRKCV